jgi:hypothetical protein
MKGSVAALLIGLLVGASSAWAQVPVVDSAKQLTFKLVNVVPRCVFPDTTDPTSGLSACTYSPPVGVCQLGPKGKGSFALLRKTNKATGRDDILIKIKVSGLENCEGLNLVPKTNVRKLHSNCPTMTCINQDTTEVGLSEPQFGCQVLAGKCRIQAFASESALNPSFNTASSATYSNITCSLGELPSLVSRLSCGLSL